MKKLVLVPYDRYQSLVSGQAKHESVTTPTIDPVQSIKDQTVLVENESEEKLAADSANDRVENLIRHIPKVMRGRARSVLSYILPYVSWNDTGEVSIKQRLIPGSNIVDLVKAHLKDYKDFRPVGKDAFREVLIELNVPKSLLTPSERLQTGKGQLPPPPGIPDKRSSSEPSVNLPEKKKVKWLRL